MKRILLIASLLFPSTVLADRLGGINTNTQVALSTQVTTPTGAMFITSATSQNNLFFTDSDSAARLEFIHSALPKSGGFGPQTVDSSIFSRQFINSGFAGSFQLSTSSYPSISSSLEGMARVTLTGPGTSTDASALLTARNTGISGAGAEASITVTPSTITFSLSSVLPLSLNNTLGVVLSDGISVSTSTNKSMGKSTLSGGTVTVNNTRITANSNIFLTPQSCSSCGTPYISARSTGTSFTITSTNGADASSVAWLIVEPTP